MSRSSTHGFFVPRIGSSRDKRCYFLLDLPAGSELGLTMDSDMNMDGEFDGRSAGCV